MSKFWGADHGVVISLLRRTHQTTTAVGWAFQPTADTAGVVVFLFNNRQPKIFYIQAYGLFGGQECPPYNDTCGVVVGRRPTLRRFCM